MELEGCFRSLGCQSRIHWIHKAITNKSVGRNRSIVGQVGSFGCNEVLAWSCCLISNNMPPSTITEIENIPRITYHSFQYHKVKTRISSIMVDIKLIISAVSRTLPKPTHLTKTNTKISSSRIIARKEIITRGPYSLVS
jgi:hypothetical protein